MKMSKILALILAFVMIVSCFASCGGGGNQGGTGTGEGGGQGGGQGGGDTNPLAGTYEITMWCSDIAGVADQFAAQIEAFEKANPGIDIKATISTKAEGDAGSAVAADVATAPDLYCFAQDQMANLVIAGALAPIAGDVANKIKNDNDAGSVAAATIAGTIYAYPLTSDNGYFMYYDSSIISEEDAKDLATIVAKCEENNLKINFEVENGWYIPAFFFGAGCHSKWTMDENGEYNAVDDNFNSDAGLKAMKAIQTLTHSPQFNNNSNEFVDIGVIVTGTWNANNAKDYFGESFAATKLPSVTVDGESFQLGSFHGYKLLGVKPQTDTKRSAVLQLLAQFLTSEQCQAERFDAFGWGPSNKVAASDPAVLADPALAALYEQREFSTMQGQIHGSWWALAGALATSARAAAPGDTDALKAALQEYADAINAIINMSDEQKQAWSIIGTINGTNWDTDFALNKVSDGVYETEVYEFKQGDMFKVRQGASWDVNFGVDGIMNGSDIAVNADGNYKVRFEYSGGATAVITLVPVN